MKLFIWRFTYPEKSLSRYGCVYTRCVPAVFFYLSTIQYNLTQLCLGSFRQEKMLPPLMMKMAVAAAPPPSGFSRCHDGQADQVPCATAKVRGGDMVRLANASALLPLLAHFVCPSCPSSRDIVGAALCCRSGL